MSATIGRKFLDEIRQLLERKVAVTTVKEKTYIGTLTGYDPDTMSVSLSDAKDEANKIFPKIIINGSIITQIFALEKPFDLKGLAERLEKVFPRMVKIYETAGVIVVMDRIRIGEEGLIEGSGPAAERVQRVYEKFIKEQEKEI